jgi:hypothetical protein
VVALRIAAIAASDRPSFAMPYPLAVRLVGCPGGSAGRTADFGCPATCEGGGTVAKAGSRGVAAGLLRREL